MCILMVPVSHKSEGKNSLLAEILECGILNIKLKIMYKLNKLKLLCLNKTEDYATHINGRQGIIETVFLIE